MCTWLGGTSCFAVRLGNTKHFMDEMHIGSSCFPPAVFTLPLLSDGDQEVLRNFNSQALLPSKIMKNVHVERSRLQSVYLCRIVSESKYFRVGYSGVAVLCSSCHKGTCENAFS